jgi:tRNA threonylcarbamoyladenosine biosynthesis protein TsaB
VKGIYLGLETSSDETGLALISDGEVIFETRGTGRLRHNENLLVFIAEAFRQTGLKLKNLSAIFLTIGPGMFTSLRCGLSVAKGLALPGSLPVKGINSLLALSATVESDGLFGTVLSLIDARKGEVYAGLFQGKRGLSEPLVTSPAGVLKLISVGQGFSLASPLIIAGNGAALTEPLLNYAGINFLKTDILFPSPVAVIRLGADLLKEEGPDDLTVLEPVYLRRTDAELKRDG